MGRKRTLTRTELFSAVEQVVRDHGPLGMTIEALARQAGVSKATVLYDYPSKTELLLDFLNAQFERHRAALDLRAAAAEQPDRAWLQGLIESLGRGECEQEPFAALLATEAMRPGAACRDMLREAMALEGERFARAAPNQRLARLAHLALHGLASTTAFGASALTTAERETILSDILHLACDGSLSHGPQDGMGQPLSSDPHPCPEAAAAEASRNT